MRIKKTYETTTTVSDGYYVISQSGECGDGSDTILLSPEQMELIISDMQNHLAAKEDWWDVGGNRSSK